MKIKITIIAKVPEGFLVPTFIALLSTHFNNLRVIDWKWSKLPAKKNDTPSI